MKNPLPSFVFCFVLWIVSVIASCGGRGTSSTSAYPNMTLEEVYGRSIYEKEESLRRRVRNDANIVEDYLAGRLDPLDEAMLPSALSGRFTEENTWRRRLIEDLLIELEETGKIERLGRASLAVDLGDGCTSCSMLKEWEGIRCRLLAAHQRLENSTHSIYPNPKFENLFGSSGNHK